MLAAERGAAEAVELICQQAGELLYDHYLQRKAFPFASEIVSSALSSQLRMAFVSHDPGEMCDEEDWGLEAEPEPAAIDTWASMQLEVRRPPDRVRGNQRGRLSTGSFARVPSRGGSSRPQSGSRSRPQSGRRPSPFLAGAGGEDGGDVGAMGRSAGSASRKTMKLGPKGAKEEKVPSKQESRSRPLPDGVHLDEEEERIREAKRQEELRVRERERRTREAERQKEEEKQKIMALHEEMDKRPHTFDSEGNLIWIEQPKVDKLPRVCEDFSFHVRANPQGGASGGPMSLGETVKLDVSDVRRQKPVRANARGSKAGRNPESEQREFTDFFSRLQHNQPPVLETMGVAPGVTLESMGKKKMGQPDHHVQRQMSRTEYVSLAEKELGLGPAMASQEAPGTGRSGGQGSSSRNRSNTNEAAALLAAAAPPASGRKPSGQAAAPVANPQLGSAPAPALAATAPAAPMANPQMGSAPPTSGPGGTPQLPPIQQRGSLPAQRGPPPPPQGSGAYPRGAMTPAPMPPSIAEGEGEEAPKNLKAPQAPPRRTRSLKSFQALGFQRPPRYHSPALGTQMGVGLAQPPIGATMGHGLVRASSEAAYYFPSPAPSAPGSLAKSGSDGSLQANSRLGGGGAPRRLADQQLGGRMVAEQTKAYQAFRQTLDPVGAITR